MSVLLFSLYLPFSRAALDRFPDAAELAGFLGVFSGISTGVALLISLFVANRLYSRFGTPVILLAYAIAYAVGFASLGAELVVCSAGCSPVLPGRLDAGPGQQRMGSHDQRDAA